MKDGVLASPSATRAALSLGHPPEDIGDGKGYGAENPANGRAFHGIKPVRPLPGRVATMNARFSMRRHWIFILVSVAMAASSANAEGCSQGCAIGKPVPSVLTVGPCEAIVKGDVWAPITCSSPDRAFATTNAWPRPNCTPPKPVTVELVGTCKHGEKLRKTVEIPVECNDGLAAGQDDKKLNSLHWILSLGYTSAEDIEALERLRELQGQPAVDAFVALISGLDVEG